MRRWPGSSSGRWASRSTSSRRSRRRTFRHGSSGPSPPPDADGRMTDPAAVSVRTRFEKFPATVKGAFVFRGEDADPHQVVVREGRVVRLPGSGGRPLPVERLTVDVPPHADVFVPFELPIGDLDPGRYGFEIEVDVDGSPQRLAGGRRLPIA